MTLGSKKGKHVSNTCTHTKKVAGREVGGVVGKGEGGKSFHNALKNKCDIQC